MEDILIPITKEDDFKTLEEAQEIVGGEIKFETENLKGTTSYLTPRTLLDLLYDLTREYEDLKCEFKVYKFRIENPDEPDFREYEGE